MTVLKADGILVKRGGRAILDSVTVSASSGEFVAIIGPNGAGKSTLLSVLAGLIAPDAGTVSLDGASLSDLSGNSLAKRRAFLPQNPRCEWPISVERLVALGLAPSLPAFGGMPESFQQNISRALEACDLEARRTQAATTLSGGELARAMLARAFVGDPEILIVDEPISGLDPRHAIDTAARLQDFAQRGKLVIAALHDLTLAVRFATRIFALREGRAYGDGGPVLTLTPSLIRDVFGVEAHISTGRGGVSVDYIGPA